MKEELFVSNSRFSSENLREPSKEEIKKIEAAKERWGVFEDAEKQFLDTLEINGYRFVSELPNGIRYPTVDEWVNSRGINSLHIRFYPAFIEEAKTKALFFCKTKITKGLDDYYTGLKTEASVLSSLPPKIFTPRLIKYIPEDKEKKQLELLVIEAVKWSEAHILPVIEWKPEHVENAMKQIGSIGKIALQDVLEVQEPTIKVEKLWEDAKKYLDKSFITEARSILDDPNIDTAPTFVHGDMWTKNILVGTDLTRPKTIFLDWARAGTGYPLEDLTRLWWDLWNNENLRNVVPKLFLGEEKKDKVTKLRGLKFGVLFAALRDIVDIAEPLPKLVDPERSRALTRIKNIQEKVLMMLGCVDNLGITLK